MSAQGLDVSNYNSPPGQPYDWAAAVKRIPDLRFGGFRLTQGLGAPGTNSPDPTAKANYDALKALGLITIAYHFLDPRLPGKDQAQYVVAQHHHIGIEQPDVIALDNETAAGMAPAAVAAVADDFMTELVAARPHSPRLVYTFIDFAKEGYCAGLGKYDLWLAYPAATAPAEPPPWFGDRFKIWQWGQRDGADADAFMGDDAALAAWVASFDAPKQLGPFRHVMQGHSLNEIASRRHTTGQHLLDVSMKAYTDADVAQLLDATMYDAPFYTSNP